MVLKLNNIYKSYSVGGSKIAVLNNINLDIEKGDFIAIMGPSGCGKSTLLNILGCIDIPDSGEYIIGDKEVNFKRLNSLSEVRNKKISFVFQNFALIKDFTVLDNVALPLKFRGISRKERQRVAKKYLKELEIEDLESKSIRELSGGQQQRVAIARALAQETDIILADEPTGALDEENTNKIMNVLKELNIKFGKTIIMVTHDKQVADKANHILKMKDGMFI
ncbi:putative ABC transport system ATP-binding protein [Clostridium sp. DSM 8431]|uniref:ABC transporter ATP-binding protein n=1 Tax=Clostridium sp. DSM 8431 TaxID=1761781 RepID=UPI0008E5F1C1|nr:ABC transporter ATP-binding protein [Clostridium sp. DSM 8431]SFU75410.1 putative ABC transport system ATP-binding protein [Clostridium sp. DSM 8431]